MAFGTYDLPLVVMAGTGRLGTCAPDRRFSLTRVPATWMAWPKAAMTLGAPARHSRH